MQGGRRSQRNRCDCLAPIDEAFGRGEITQDQWDESRCIVMVAVDRPG